MVTIHAPVHEVLAVNWPMVCLPQKVMINYLLIDWLAINLRGHQHFFSENSSLSDEHAYTRRPRHAVSFNSQIHHKNVRAGNETMADLVYYPIRFWGLDQLYQAKVKLNVADALALKEYPGFSGAYEKHICTCYCIKLSPVLKACTVS